MIFKLLGGLVLVTSVAAGVRWLWVRCDRWLGERADRRYTGRDPKLKGNRS